MSRETEKKLLDVGLWFEHNRRNTLDPVQRMDFCMRALEHIIWLTSYVVEDIKRLEGYKERDVKIILPFGANYEPAIDELRLGNGDD